MTELARGAVADRPWGRTLAALGLRGVTGQLALHADGKRYEIAFVGGTVVAATSPLASDAAARIAMTVNLVSSTQVADLARRQAAAPQRDEIELIAEVVKLSAEQAERLRRRVIALRAARTFSIDRGEFVVDSDVTLPATAELDIRTIVYLGARQNLSEARLATELAALGSYFQLKDGAADDLPQFGFTPAEAPVLAALRTGGTLAALEAAAAAVDPRVVRAAIYALAASGACEHVPPDARPRPAPAPAPAPPPTRDSTSALDPATTPRAVRRPAPGKDPAQLARQVEAVKALVAERAKNLHSLDHFAVLGIPQGAPAVEVRKAYFALARQLHPDKLAALGVADDDHVAHRLFARINTAFAVLDNPQTRRDYEDVLARGGEEAVREEQAKAEALALRALEAENAYRRGEMALRRDQLTTALNEFKQALELDPDTSDYIAMVAWTQFCAAPDKLAIAGPTRAALEKAIAASPRAVTAYVVLGRVERMLGRDAEARTYFQKALKLSPGHADASMELRVIEARLAQPPKR